MASPAIKRRGGNDPTAAKEHSPGDGSSEVIAAGINIKVSHSAEKTQKSGKAGTQTTSWVNDSIPPPRKP